MVTTQAIGVIVRERGLRVFKVKSGVNGILVGLPFTRMDESRNVNHI